MASWVPSPSKWPRVDDLVSRVSAPAELFGDALSYSLTQNFIPVELERKWLDKRGVHDDDWRFLAAYLAEGKELRAKLLAVVERICQARDWWLDVQADQRFRHAHPWRWALASRFSRASFSWVSTVVPFLYPSWISDMHEVERRINLLEEMHKELCRFIGFAHHCMYRLLQWRSRDPARLAAEAKERVKEQQRIQTSCLVDLAERLLTIEMGASSIIETTGWSQGQSPSGVWKVSMMDLEGATSHALMDVGKPGHLSRWRGAYLMSFLSAVAACTYALWRQHSPTELLLQCSSQGMSTLRQFFQEWVEEPYQKITTTLLASDRGDPILAADVLAYEKEVLTNMTHNFYQLVGAPITTEAESKIRDGDITLAVDYFEGRLDDPILSMVRGYLIESSMLQAQKMKVTMFDMCHSIENMMADVRLNVAVSSLFPISTLLYFAFSFMRRRRERAHNYWVRDCRRKLDELDRKLNEMGVTEAFPPVDEPLEFSTPRFHDNADFIIGHRSSRHAVAELLLTDKPRALHRTLTLSKLEEDLVKQHREPNQNVTWEQSGLVLSNLSVLWTVCERGLSAREIRCFTEDMSSLSSPALTVPQKLHIVGRMRLSYSCFDFRAVP